MADEGKSAILGVQDDLYDTLRAMETYDYPESGIGLKTLSVASKVTRWLAHRLASEAHAGDNEAPLQAARSRPLSSRPHPKSPAER